MAIKTGLLVWKKHRMLLLFNKYPCILEVATRSTRWKKRPLKIYCSDFQANLLLALLNLRDHHPSWLMTRWMSAFLLNVMKTITLQILRGRHNIAIPKKPQEACSLLFSTWWRKRFHRAGFTIHPHHMHSKLAVVRTFTCRPAWPSPPRPLDEFQQWRSAKNHPHHPFPCTPP